MCLSVCAFMSMYMSMFIHHPPSFLTHPHIIYGHVGGLGGMEGWVGSSRVELKQYALKQILCQSKEEVRSYSSHSTGRACLCFLAVFAVFPRSLFWAMTRHRDS